MEVFPMVTLDEGGSPCVGQDVFVALTAFVIGDVHYGWQIMDGTLWMMNHGWHIMDDASWIVHYGLIW
ncbi:unnamed protein product [Arabidopsis thaliana]|uniref:Uncharacterized protein n=3 Tax=Arabidopsis thaliana TaxID=3702 RepID=A0A5S9YB07_ARATH|nr:unnamed protein product [Arabidopsis thaliana]